MTANAFYSARIEGESKFASSFVLVLLTNQCTIRLSRHSTQISHQASFMPPRRTLTGKAAMASRCAEFLAAHDRTQNGREAVASRRAEFIAAHDLTPMWAEFEDAKTERARGSQSRTEGAKKSESTQEKRGPPPQERKGRTRCCGEVSGDPSTVGCR